MAEDSRDRRASDEDLGAALHEVGNALTVILGWLDASGETLRSGIDRRIDPAAALEEALRGVEVAATRVRRAHRIARRAIGAGSPDAPAVEPLAALVREVTQGLEPTAHQSGVRIVAVIDADAAALDVEAGERLIQVLTNLLLNALSVTPRGEEVRVTVSAPPDAVVIVVEDAGSGIAPADRDRIFQRGATGRPDGAGIGLAHAMALTQEQGGALGLEPFVEGRGARFRLAWPIASPSSGSPPHTIRPTMLDGVRVVVLDDDVAVIELLDTFLSSRGADVRPCRSARELVDALAKAPADVVLLDASPLADDLVGGLRSLLQAHPRTDFVLVSGADPGPVVTGLGVTWVKKPFEVHEIIEVVRVLRATPRPT